MNWILRYTGAVLTVISAYAVTVSYKKYVQRAERESESFLSLMDYLRIRIDCYLSTVAEVLSDFKDDAIEPFLAKVREGNSAARAFALTQRSLAIGKEGREILSRLFSLVCGEYKTGVISAIDSSREAFSAYMQKANEEGRKNVRLVSALILGAVLGAVILLI